MTTNGHGLTRHAVENQPEIIKNFRMCYMKGCLGMGSWSPVVSVSPDGLQRAYLKLKLMLVCDHHRDVIGIDDLVDGPISDGRSAWESIQAAFASAGKDTPEKEFTTLKWQLA